MKSPTPRSRQNDSPFSKEEEIWIVRNAGDKPFVTVRCQFIIHFKKTNKHKVPRACTFDLLLRHFNKTGGVTGSRALPFVAARTPENIQKVAD